MKYLFIVLLLVVYGSRYWYATHRFTNGQYLRVTGTLFSEPVTRTKQQIVTLSGIQITLPTGSVSLGDSIVVEGTYHDGALINSTIVAIKEGGTLSVAKKNMLAFFKRASNPPHSSLMTGMALGSKSLLSYDFWQLLQKTGTAHVVVASGTNIALVGGVVLSLAPYIGRKKALSGALICIWLYVFIVGFDAPIIRAGVMGSIAFLAQALGRPSASVRALVVTAIVMLLMKPLWIADLGFLLSFAATLSLILFVPPINRLIHFIPNVVREGLSTSLAAQIGVAPILLLAFGTINPLAPLINTAISPVIAPITILSLVSSVISLISPSIAQLIVYMTYPFTAWFIAMITLFS